MYKSVIKFSDRQDLWDRWGRVYCNKEFYNEDSGPDAAMKFFVDNEAEMLRGVKVLWPDKETYYDLMVMREQKGSLSFDSEKQNEPRDASGLSIDMNKVVFWEDKFQAIEDIKNFLGNQKVVLGSCDPSIGKTNKSDYSAIITVYMNKANKDLYVIRADVGRWNLETLVQTICIQHETHGFTTFLYEANAAQAWLGDIIKKEPVLIPIKPVTNVIPKEARIMKLMLYIEQGKIKLSRNLTELNRQLEQYPYGAHDDAIDALAMIIDAAESFSRLDINLMKSAFDTIKKPHIGRNSKSFLYGGRPFENPFGLFSL